MKKLFSKKKPLLIIALIAVVGIIAVLILYVYYLMDYNTYIELSKIRPYNGTKRVAVLLSGKVRKGYEGCLWSQIIFIIHQLKADVFFCLDGNETQETRQSIEHLLKPVAHVWSTDNLGQIVNNGMTDPTAELMFKKIHDCNELKRRHELRNQFKYDVVVRLRPDLVVKDHIPLDVISNLLPRTVYYPKGTKFDILTSNPVIGITDEIAVGDSETMDIYAGVYKFIYPTYIKMLQAKKAICPAAESMLSFYLAHAGLKSQHYYQRFVLFEKRLNRGNVFKAVFDWVKKAKYYPAHKCFYQNTFM